MAPSLGSEKRFQINGLPGGILIPYRESFDFKDLFRGWRESWEESPESQAGVRYRFPRPLGSSGKYSVSAPRCSSPAANDLTLRSGPKGRVSKGGQPAPRLWPILRDGAARLLRMRLNAQPLFGLIKNFSPVAR